MRYDDPHNQQNRTHLNTKPNPFSKQIPAIKNVPKREKKESRKNRHIFKLN